MKQAHDLMSAIRCLIELEDDAADEYFATGMTALGRAQIPFGTCIFSAGLSHDHTALLLRTELATLEAEYGPNS